MKVELLYWDGCPSHPEARALLADVLREAGVTSLIEDVEVATDAGKQDIGVVVDQVNEVMEIPDSEIEPAPSFGSAIRSEFKFSGAPNADGQGWASNITPHQRGLAAWSEDDIAELLKTGFTPEFDSVGSSMADVVKNMSALSKTDRDAMAEYLKSLPAIEGPPKPAKK